MTKLFADITQMFNEFYISLNTKGQFVFVVMIFLLIVLFSLLAFTSIITYFERKTGTSKAIKNLKLKKEEKDKNKVIKQEVDNGTLTKNIYEEISKVVENKKNIELTDFEEEQENEAIISYEELKNNYSNIEFVDDESIYDNIVLNNFEKKKFKVSEVISPIFGTVKFDQGKSKENNNENI